MLLLHPRLLELWLSPTFPHHLDSLPWFSLPNFGAKPANGLRLPSSQIPFLSHSYSRFSRPVTRALGRHFLTCVFCLPVLLPEFCKPHSCPSAFGAANLNLPHSLYHAGDVGWENTDGEKNILAFVLVVWIWQHPASWSCSCKESPSEPQAGANLLGQELWGNGGKCLNSFLAETAKIRDIFIDSFWSGLFHFIWGFTTCPDLGRFLFRHFPDTKGRFVMCHAWCQIQTSLSRKRTPPPTPFPVNSLPKLPTNIWNHLQPSPNCSTYTTYGQPRFPLKRVKVSWGYCQLEMKFYVGKYQVTLVTSRAVPQGTLQADGPLPPACAFSRCFIYLKVAYDWVSSRSQQTSCWLCGRRVHCPIK